MARAVYKIPKGQQNTPTQKKEPEVQKKRVAAYARVSTDNEEQASSYQTQVDYYTNYIQGRSDWKFVEVYTDEGISGTSTKKREGFKRMIEDALAGKIDLIITKSISRFARNTVDTLSAIRQLKEKNIGVYFEKENINTLDGKGEVLLTIMSSLAQEESRSISENVTWSLRKRFEEGKASVGYSRFLGYDKDFVINEDEAAIVRQIYQWYIKGYSFGQIANKCMDLEYPTPSGKQKWYPVSVKNILTNEKYKGDALLQKGYTPDFLTHKRVINNGEVQQYYVKEHHPAIISPEMFDKVQVLMTARAQTKGLYAFSGRIVCGECGGTYRRKTLHSTDKYKKVVWGCHNKTKSKHQVSFLEIPEIEKAFTKAVCGLLAKKEEVIPVMQEKAASALEIGQLEADKEKLIAERDHLEDSLEEVISLNSSQAVSTSTYEELSEEFGQLELEIQKLDDVINQQKNKLIKINGLLEAVNEKQIAYSEERFRMMVEQVEVHADKKLDFKFWDGSIITVQA